MARRATAKFRYNAALAIAGFVALCGAVPLAASRWYLWFVLLAPVAVMMWGARAGVDVRDGALAVRWAVGGRRVDAGRIAGFTITYRAVRAVLDDGRTVWLPAVPGSRVPVLADAVGLTLATAPSTPAANHPADAEDTDDPPADAGDTDGRPADDHPADGDGTDDPSRPAENHHDDGTAADAGTAEPELPSGVRESRS